VIRLRFIPLLVAASLLTVGVRAAEVIQDAPLPPPRPPEAGAPAEAVPPAQATPLPPERPADLAPADAKPVEPPAAPNATPTAAPLPEPVPEPPPRPADLAAPVLEPPPPEPDDAECRARLGTLGVAFTPHEPLADGTCGAQRPLRVTALPDGLALSAPVVTRCPVAEALARWGSDVRAAAAKHLGARPVRLLIGGSYECRGRNHDPGAKLSEHAYADAVDVMGFGFEGRPDLPVAAGQGSPEAAFLAETRAKACEQFTTVLGPGTDSEHANHFHFDLRARKNGYRLCQ
jgi:hypothetical protein